MSEKVVSYVDIRPLIQKVDNMQNDIAIINNKVCKMSDELTNASKELESLNRQFTALMQDRIRAEALSQATTELVRVRQEIEKEFGEYGQVRKTMLGVLQATDLALVKKTTISNVSEELMISTPKYWLAPCLIAIAAWINNDRDLAERAIKEAMKRDEERTSLTMALICRRNSRTEACYEWLGIYFSHLNAGNFSEGGYTFVDAYINGVFGPDEKHICSDYISIWLKQIKENDSEFESNQEKAWENYCISKTCSCEDKYPELKQHVVEFNNIKAYADRIYSVDSLIEEFESINNAKVDIDKIKEKVDENLVQVISNYAVEEIRLRDDEICFQAVKNSRGNIKYEDAKRQLLQERKEQQQKKISFIEQMMKAIADKEHSTPSERKTAISILRSYINRGYNKYINDKKSLFPEKISISINGYQIKADTDSDVNAIKRDYKKHMQDLKNEEIKNYNEKTDKNRITAAIGVTVGAILLAILINPIILLAIPVYFGYKYYKSHKNPSNGLQEIESKYNTAIEEGFNTIDKCISEWNDVNNKVNTFDNDKKYLVA